MDEDEPDVLELVELDDDPFDEELDDPDELSPEDPPDALVDVDPSPEEPLLEPFFDDDDPEDRLSVL